MLASFAADIVFAYDESISNAAADLQTWFQNSLVPQFENLGFADSLKNKGITDIQYGLVGFGSGGSVSYANSLLVDPAEPSAADKLFGTNAQLVSSINNLTRNNNGREDGWDALEHIIAEYDFRPGAVPVVVLLQNAQGRSPLNTTLTRDGVLAALDGKDVLLNTMVVGQHATQPARGDLFDLEPYGVHGDVRIFGVEADVTDGVPAGRHSFHWVDTNASNPAPDAPGATTVDALQVSFDGSNTGATGMVGSARSLLITKRGSGGIGPNDAGYRATNVSFAAVDMSGATVVNNETEAISLSQVGQSGAFNFFGQNYSNLWATPWGTITFDDFDWNGSFSTNLDLSGRDNLPNLNLPAKPTIAALWDATNGSVRSYKVSDFDGDSLNDIAIQWEDTFYAVALQESDGDSIAYQLVLYANGDIRINYIDLDSPSAANASGGISATVGIWHPSASQSVDVPAGIFAPGLHTVAGSTGPDSADPWTETNDSYVRMAWDTGGAA